MISLGRLQRHLTTSQSVRSLRLKPRKRKKNQWEIAGALNHKFFSHCANLWYAKSSTHECVAIMRFLHPFSWIQLDFFFERSEKLRNAQPHQSCINDKYSEDSLAGKMRYSRMHTISTTISYDFYVFSLAACASFAFILFDTFIHLMQNIRHKWMRMRGARKRKKET
jgi:hypothetical protein